VTGSAAEIDSAEAELDAYAAQAAHQLGEAAALLRGYVDVLEQRARGDAELDDVLSGLGAGVDRVKRFVEDLLDLTTSRRVEPAREHLALDEALATAREHLATELAVAEVRSTAPLPIVWADRKLMTCLLTHLLRVALAAGARTIHVEGIVTHGIAQIELRDDGAPAGCKPFAPFAPARGRGPLIGAGVGLTLSRRIVERHGGTIALRGGADGATAVTFTLPTEE
jgi:signal transduction histidine kinase